MHYVHIGRVVRVRRGIYRLVHFPAGEHEELVAAWLWSEPAGVVSHQTALALHGLSDARHSSSAYERPPGAVPNSRASGGSSCSIASSRASSVLGDAATLKGGLVLELCLERARTTKDVDLRMMGSADGTLAKLQEAARRDAGDFMTFEIHPDDDHPEIQDDGMRYAHRR